MCCKTNIGSPGVCTRSQDLLMVLNILIMIWWWKFLSCLLHLCIEEGNFVNHFDWKHRVKVFWAMCSWEQVREDWTVENWESKKENIHLYVAHHVLGHYAKKWEVQVICMKKSKNIYQIWFRKHHINRLLQTPRHELEDNVKIHILEVGYENVTWTELTQCGVK